MGVQEIRGCIDTYPIKELVIERNIYENGEIYKELTQLREVLITSFSADKEEFKTVESKIGNYLKLYQEEGILEACYLGGLYLEKVIGYNLESIQKVVRIDESEDHFELDRSSIINLEIFHTIIDGSKKNSLVSKIDYTKTAMGGRKLRSWLVRPLKRKNLIFERLKKVKAFYESGDEFITKVQKILGGVYDIDRLLAKVNAGIASPKDLVALYQTIQQSEELSKLSKEISNKVLVSLFNQIPACENCETLLDLLKMEDPKVTVREGGIFKDGFNDDLDKLRDLRFNGKNYLLEIQKRESDKNDISTLKLGFNKVFGYYLEVSKGKVDKVPDYFIRKQTLTNSERYITPELKEYEEKVLNAEDEIKDLEYKLFIELLDQLKAVQDEAVKLSEVVTKIDLGVSLANLALDNDYCKPELVEDKSLNIKKGRHPVIENILGRNSFIPNDVSVVDDNIIKIITGPNMGGKSTYLRQTALICLLAQIGSFVPAEKAKIGIVDQIFSRVGAADNLSRGESTFMVEMKETAYILNQATEKSLIIMDEVGRGTSTSDGLSLAFAIVDYLSDKVKARVFFATHYHELVEHAEMIDRVENLSIAVTHDDNQKPIFLHKIVKGGVDKSYGIEVADTAGLPEEIIKSSKEYLEKHNNNNSYDRSLDKKSDRDTQDIKSYNQNSLFNKNDERLKKISEFTENIDVNKITPIQALQRLDEILEEIRKHA